MARLAIHVYHRTALWIEDRIREAAPDREIICLTDREELSAHLDEIEVLFAPTPPHDGWAGAKKLRLIQLLGAGVDTLLPSPDLPDAVEVAGLRGEFAPEVSEHVIGMMLALTKHLPHWMAESEARRFQQMPSDSLVGKTLVMVGTGAVGQRVARIASAMDMDVIGVRNRDVSAEGFSRVVPVEQLDRVLPRADYLVLAVPRTPATLGLFHGDRLRILPRGARIINVARGGILDETVLEELLRDEHLAGVALDVFNKEPLPQDSTLWTTPNLIITPHVAGLGERYLERAVTVLLENVRRLESDEPRTHLVDRTLGY